MLACLSAATAQPAAPKSARDSIRWEQVLVAYQTFCELAVEARSGDTGARTQLRGQADAISAMLAEVKGSSMTASQQARFEKMKKRYAAVVTLPDITAAPIQAPAPVQVIQGQTVVIRDTVFVVREIRQTDTVRIVEQVEKLVEVPVERIVEVPLEIEPDRGHPSETIQTKGSLKTHYLIVAQAVVPDWSYGVLVGVMQKAGLYVHFDSNFLRRAADYSCTADGQTSYGQIWTTGRSEITRLSVTGGALWHPTNWLSAYAGAGYGARRLLWEDISGHWAEVSDVSCRSIPADAGLIFNFDHCALSAGITTLGFSRFDAVLGLGFLF